MVKPEKLKKAIRCCLDIDSMDKNCVSTGCPLFTADLEDDCMNTLLKDALAYIEMLEGVIKSAPRYLSYDLLSLVRDTCGGYLHCSECPLSDADGDCPFITKEGVRLLPCEWGLWRLGGQMVGGEDA